MSRLHWALVKFTLIWLDDPSKERYGLEICAATGLPSGTVHPILARLEGLNWVDSAWEQTDPREQGRPRRRITG